MLKFAVYKDSVAADDWQLHQAHLLTTDDIGLLGEVTFANGTINCEKRSVEAAALGLMVETISNGTLLLQTCLLPDREEAYILHLELTRHRIKTFLVKLEDWMLFELVDEHPVMKQWEDARQLFTEAMIMESKDKIKCDKIAKQALDKAITATENLAIMHADALLAQRYAEGRMPAIAFGCQVHQSMYAEPLTRIVKKDFDFISIPIRWCEIEPEEGQYDWTKLDKWMNWARKTDYPIVAGPIVDFRSLSVPQWLYVWEHDYDTTHDLLYEHIEAVISRYRDVVTTWNVATSLHINENFTLAYDELLDVIRMATSLAKTLDPKCQTMVEVTEPWGEYYASNTKSIPPIIFAQTLSQSGFKLDTIGINIQAGHHRNGRAARDLMQLSIMLDKLLYLDMPVVISGIGVPSHRPKMEDADPAGFWRQPWSPVQQGEWLAKVTALCLSRPYIESVCVHELYDHDASELPTAGLITAGGRGKPSLVKMSQLHKELKNGTMRCSVPEERIWINDDKSPSAD